MSRLFFALWPDSEVREQLADVQRVFEAGVARRLAPELFHVTLIYMGASDARQQSCYESMAEEIRVKRFEITIDQTGSFRRAQVAYVKPACVPEELVQLNRDLNQLLQGQCGFKPESRPYRPHVTLFRKFKQKETPVAITPIQWRVDRFALVASVSGARGVEYHPLRFWSLEAD